MRLDHTPVLIDRGMLFAAAHHAFDLYRWFAMPDSNLRDTVGSIGQPKSCYYRAARTGGMSPPAIRLQPVAALISSTVTPGAISFSAIPSLVTSNKP